MLGSTTLTIVRPLLVVTSTRSTPEPSVAIVKLPEMSVEIVRI